MAPPDKVREIPGFWYDESQKRYFRITQDNRPPPSRPQSSAEGKSKYQEPSLLQLMWRSEIGAERISAHTPMATLLATTPVKVMQTTNMKNVEYENGNLEDCFPVLAHGEGVGLFGYQEERMVDFKKRAWINQHISAFDWDCNKKVIIFAMSLPMMSDDAFWDISMCFYGSNSIGGLDDQHHVAMCTGLRSPYHSVAMLRSPWNGPPADISIIQNSRFLRLSSTGEKGTMAMGWEDDMKNPWIKILTHADDSPGLVTTYPRVNEVWSGTRAGSVYRWDLRRRRRAVCSSFMPSGSYDSVVDMKLREEKLITSCWGNGVRNLAMWDCRMIGGGADPVLVFGGHVNSHKNLKFDFTDEGGLVMAGGDDAKIRIWNARTGGSWIASRQFGELAEKVKLVGWGEGSDTPGAWIKGSRNLYSVNLGREKT